MKGYHVIWEIDLDADTPADAARQALAIQRDRFSQAIVFDVIEADSNGEAQRIDLFDLEKSPELIARRPVEMPRVIVGVEGGIVQGFSSSVLIDLDVADHDILSDFEPDTESMAYYQKLVAELETLRYKG